MNTNADTPDDSREAPTDEELIASARYRQLADSAHDIIYGIDRNGRVSFHNSAATRVLDFGTSSLVGRHYLDLVAESDRERVNRFYLRQLARKIPNTYLEFLAYTPDGSELWLGQNVQLVVDEEESLGFYAVARDISERRSIERALRQSEERLRSTLEDLARARDAALESSRIKSAFLANMSHEIRTPMNGIIGLAGLMLGTELTPEQREYMAMIRGSAESLLGMLSNVVDVARLEAGGIELASASYDLRELVDDVAAAFRLLALERGLHLSAIVYRGVPERTVGDAARVRQVLENLVGNALKFTNEGDVLVRVRPSRDSYGRRELRFEISDTGIGMSAEEIPRLFDPFTQADESPTRGYGGAGLGLAISQRLVHLMGGVIGVDATVPHGTTVWFTIPSGESPGSGEPPQEQRSYRAEEGAPGPRILVVEDNPVNRMVTLGQLRQNGVTADVATDGWEALDALARGSYDLILMDCDMPSLDGCAATELIRHFEAPDDHVVIVAVTAAGDERARARCLESGMDEFLAKPVSAAQLGAVLGRITTLRRDGIRRKVGAAGDATLDLRALDRLGLFDAARNGLLDDAISSFIRGGEGRLEALGAALERRDAESVRDVAHQLSGSARSLGARRLARLLGELEHWLPERRIEGARFIERHIRRAFDAAAGALLRAMRVAPSRGAAL